MKKTLLLLLLATNVRANEATPTPTAPTVEEQKFAEARAAADKKDYARALTLYRELAARGHAKAMKEIGLMYVFGRGVPRDYASARQWHEKQAAAGDNDGYWYMGKLYEEGGPGLEPNYATALGWYEKYAANGDGNTYWHMGELYKQGGPGLEKDWGAAKRNYARWVARTGSGEGLIGELYEQGGPGLEKDWAAACYYYRKAEWKDKADLVCPH